MNRITINTEHQKATINRNIYGHFSEHLGRCIYQGLYVGENSAIPNVNGMRTDVVRALQHIRVPVLRWPGGCFADEYHWQDGIGPRATRKRMINTHWGGVEEDNAFGTHEFMELCRQIGCEPYINGNVGSGTVREMSEWVEYLTFGGTSPMSELRGKNGQAEPWRVKYFGVGNENWGCGGNMRPAFYADVYRQFQTYLRNYGDNKLYKIACGPNGDDYDWTDVLMKNASKCMDALTLHHYTVPYNWTQRGRATQFSQEAYYETLVQALRMEELIEGHLQIMHRHDPEHRVGLIVDEWGTWYDVEPNTNPGFLYQQNTMRDAMVAALTLNIFNQHADRVVMANLAQTVNVLQAVILTDGDHMVLTPTYHVFDLFKAHQDAMLVDCYVSANTVGTDGRKISQISASASLKNDIMTVTVANTSDCDAAAVEIDLIGMKGKQVKGRLLSGAADAYNDFGAEQVATVLLDEVSLRENIVELSIPSCGIVELSIAMGTPIP